MARGAVNNYQGNDAHPTLTITVPLSVYQQNKMERRTVGLTPNPMLENPNTERSKFVISNQ